MNSSYLNAAAGAFLGVVFVVMTISITSEGIFHSAVPETEGFAIQADESAGAGESAAPAAEEVAPIAPLMASADPAAGENVFKKCASCHSVDPSGTNKVGPGLYGVVGRPVASHEGFNYSAGMKEHVSVDPDWSYEALNHFLHAPKKYVPGTAMGFAGLKKEEDRANVIAYLRTQSDNPVPLPDPAAAPAEGDQAAAPAEGDATAAPAEGDTAAAPAEGATSTDEAAPTSETTPADGGAAATEEAAPADGAAATEEAAPAGDATAPASDAPAADAPAEEPKPETAQ